MREKGGAMRRVGGSRVKCRWVWRWFGAPGLVALAAGCATYHPEPLPDAAAVVTAPAPDAERLRVAAESLEHPLLEPVPLNLADGLSPEEAGVLAVLANPSLVAVRDAHGEAAAQLVAAGLLPNPEFSLELTHPHGAGSSGTVNAHSAGLGIAVSQLVGRAARVAEASAALDAVDLGIAWQEWQTAQAASLMVVRLAGLRRRLALVHEEIGFQHETVAALVAAVRGGDATIQALGIQRAALEDLRQLEGDLAREAAGARSRLARLVGLPPGTPLEPAVPEQAGELSALPPAETLARRAVSRRLDLRALELGYRAHEARVRRAVLEQFPSLSIGITSQRDEASLRFLGGFVTLGLPLFDRNQARIAAERATRSRLEHEYEARLASVRADVARLAAEDGLLEGQIRLAGEGITALEETEKAERAEVAAGDVSRLTWQSVRSSLFDLRLRRETLHQARGELRVALSAALGSREVMR